MTLAGSTVRNDYVGNGATSVYPYTFKIFQNSDLTVTIRNLSNIETTLVLNTDYTVTGAGNSGGGTITLTAGNLATGFALNIRRVLSLTQTTDIRNQGDYHPEAVEDTFDRLTMVDQQQQDNLDRSLRLPKTETGSEASTRIPTSTERANKFLGFDSSGNPIAASSMAVGALTVSSYIETLLDDANAAAARTTLGFAGASGTVQAANIETDAVTTAKILDANVTLAKLAESVRTFFAVFGGASSGGTDAYAVSPSPAFTAYVAGLIIVFTADVANTAGATLNVNGLGAKTLKDSSGNTMITDSILAGQMVACVYNGTDFICIGIRQVRTKNEIVLRTANGNGSTNTRIERFLTVESNFGSAMTLTQSATDGDSITINQSGYYSVTRGQGPDNQYVGVSKNSNQLSTNINLITVSHVMAYSVKVINTYHPIAVTFWADAGDIVRGHNSGFNANDLFRIVKVG